MSAALHRPSMASTGPLSFQNMLRPADAMTADADSPFSTRARIGASENVAASEAPLLDVAAKRLGDEGLILATNVAPRAALEAYRKRWAIECLFGDTKTRGLNLEDTRLREPRKLSLLMALVALAIAWAGRTAADRLGRRNPPRKAHGS